MIRHAEIAGGGIGGLTLATMLAQTGWTVRVHERAEELRESGTGIFLKNNCVDVFEEAGVFDAIATEAFHVERAVQCDAAGTIVASRPLAGTSRMYATMRQTVMQSLYASAARAGVDIVVDSTVVSAAPQGEITLANGRRYTADLVVAADGVHSQLRGALVPKATVTKLPTIINRYVLPTREFGGADMVEHWSGRYRVATAPCSATSTYAFQVFPEGDRAAGDRTDWNVWSNAFPQLGRLFTAMAGAGALRSNYQIVRCPVWHRGRVAILGDAAHGLPPTLGQGAGLTVMNARGLVAALARTPRVEDALPAWERAVRFLSDISQRWALRYDFVTRSWPRRLNFARPAVLWSMTSVPRIRNRMLIADRGLLATPLVPLEPPRGR